MFENKRTLNAGYREPADASSSQEDYLTKSESCKTARLFGVYVWKESYADDYNIVMSHIRHIRAKIEDDPSHPVYIQTVWGVGYRFNQNMANPAKVKLNNDLK